MTSFKPVLPQGIRRDPEQPLFQTACKRSLWDSRALFVTPQTIYYCVRTAVVVVSFCIDRRGENFRASAANPRLE